MTIRPLAALIASCMLCLVSGVAQSVTVYGVPSTIPSTTAASLVEFGHEIVLGGTARQITSISAAIYDQDLTVETVTLRIYDADGSGGVAPSLGTLLGISALTIDLPSRQDVVPGVGFPQAPLTVFSFTGVVAPADGAIIVTIAQSSEVETGWLLVDPSGATSVGSVVGGWFDPQWTFYGIPDPP